jgi:hypothetical protein
MGADLLLAVLWTTRDRIDWEKGEAEIDLVTDNEIESESFGEGVGLDDTAFMAEVVRPRLRIDLDEIRSYWEGRNDRATDVYRFGPVRALISGGTSWGDDPSEMFTIMTRLPERVATECGFFR